MAALGSQTIAASFEQLLHVDTDGGGNTTTLVPVKDGDNGTTFAMQLSTTTVCIDDPTTSSATQGGVLRLQSDDGAVMASGHRLGVIEFGGAEDTSSTITTGARIEALADATWSASENGADMIFYTTDGNASQSEVMRLTADSGTLFNNDVYTANGTGLIVGNTAQVAMGEVTAEAQILGTTETDASLAIGLWSTTDALSPSLKFVKGAHATIGTHTTTVADNEELGKIQAYGSDATDSDTLSSEIAFNIDDTGVGAGTLGGEILLKTAGVDGTLDTAVTIDNAQKVTTAGDLAVGGGLSGFSMEMFYPAAKDGVTTTGYNYYRPAPTIDEDEGALCHGVAPNGFSSVSAIYVWWFKIADTSSGLNLKCSWSAAADGQANQTHTQSNVELTEADAGENFSSGIMSRSEIGQDILLDSQIAAGDVFGVGIVNSGIDDCHVLGISIVWAF